MSVEEDERISRSIIYHKAFINSIHTDDHLFIFGETKQDGASHESAIARCVAKNDDDVHRIGCAIADDQNKRTARGLHGQPIPPNKQRYYCGFRTAKLSEMVLTGDKYRIQVTHDGDPDPSHVDVALFVDSTDKSERNTIKTDAGLALADAFGEAVEHICEYDQAANNHPLKRNPACLREGLPRFFASVVDAATTPADLPTNA